MATKGTVILSLFLMFEIHMIVGGSHKYKIAPNDYCFAAIVIYLDFINVAIFILKFMGKKLNLKVGNKSVDIVK